MSKICKYRAWDKERKRYLPDEFIDQLFLRQDGKVMWWSHAGFEDVTDKFDIEFWTGLKDKNGTEIYAEDKVSGIWMMDKKTIKAGVVRYYERFGLYAIDIKGNMQSIVWNTCEVTGTVHEKGDSNEQCEPTMS